MNVVKTVYNQNGLVAQNMMVMRILINIANGNEYNMSGLIADRVNYYLEL